MFAGSEIGRMLRSETELERVPYAEAREWFWVRTIVWSVPTYIVSAMGCFAYASTVIEPFSARLVTSLLTALAATLLAVISASISKSFPWMRLGWRRLWWLNLLVTGAMAAFLAVGLSLVTLTVLRDYPHFEPGSAYYNRALSMMSFGVAIAAFWGAAFGSWFALRLDKYFVESI